jgi:biopolymer transport protein TolR
MAANLSSNSRTRNRRKKIVAEINVTPLVDVMLVLLIIFMVTSPMLVSGIKVDLPQTSYLPVPGDDEPLSLTLDAKGQIYLQDHKITLHELIPKLKAITKEKMDTRIFVSGDKNVDYGKVIALLQDVNEAGFNKVALITTVTEGSSNEKRK